MQQRMFRDVCSEAGVSPPDVSFVELNGTGTVIGDIQETNSVADVFCSNGRSGPLLIGSVKSNMGHSEISSGLASLAKVIIAMHDHEIPPNLHFDQPNPDIPALFDGRLKVTIFSSLDNIILLTVSDADCYGFIFSCSCYRYDLSYSVCDCDKTT